MALTPIGKTKDGHILWEADVDRCPGITGCNLSFPCGFCEAINRKYRSLGNKVFMEFALPKPKWKVNAVWLKEFVENPSNGRRVYMLAGPVSNEFVPTAGSDDSCRLVSINNTECISLVDEYRINNPKDQRTLYLITKNE